MVIQLQARHTSTSTSTPTESVFTWTGDTHHSN